MVVWELIGKIINVFSESSYVYSFYTVVFLN